MCKGPEAHTHWVCVRNMKGAGVKSGRIAARDESREVTGLIGHGEEPIIFSKSDEKPMEGSAQKK